MPWAPCGEPADSATDGVSATAPTRADLTALVDDFHLANRELESLQSIGRVLELAEDHHTSLGDRCRFLHLVQANLDAFLMVRGGLLHALQETGASSREEETHLSLPHKEERA